MASKEKFKTYENVFDESTLRVLFKLSSQGYFDELESPISIGKESNVFSAIKGKERVIVKIYRVNACDFKRMYNYMIGDPRFKGIQKQRRKVIQLWAKREFSNLHLSRKARVGSPTPFVFRDNVLVMEFIGKNAKVARKLKEQAPKDIKKFGDKLILSIKRLYQRKLVHGDLSEYNILNYEEKPIIIDFSHGVTLRHPRADELLKRDIKIIVHYLNKQGLTLKVDEVYNKITENGL